MCTAVERDLCTDNAEVAGSIPASPTTDDQGYRPRFRVSWRKLHHTCTTSGA
jgi:hypothetical protein